VFQQLPVWVIISPLLLTPQAPSLNPQPQPQPQQHPQKINPQIDLDGAEIEDGSSSSGDGSDSEMDQDDDDSAPAALPLGGEQHAQQAKPEPVVDADGFELVQGRRGRGRR